MENAIKERLIDLNLEVFEFRDDSHLHAGHAGARSGGHYALLLVSDFFNGKNRVQRQRDIQNLLADLFEAKKIHALSIIAKTPNEYFVEN